MFEQLDGKTTTIFQRQLRAVVDEAGKFVQKFVNVPLLRGEERSECMCCRKRKKTTVNGVCLDCQKSDKRQH
jgi:hypothetical protein